MAAEAVPTQAFQASVPLPRLSQDALAGPTSLEIGGASAAASGALADTTAKSKDPN
jgi:hypothetical protein